MYLWIDLWDKRCWVAIEIQGIVLPKWIILRPKLISELKKLVLEYNIKTIVVWLPYDLYWKNLRQLDKTKIFINKLKDIFPNLNIEWIDERFTSFEADYVLQSMWVNNKQWQKDDISAALILESFLKQNNI